MTRPTLSQSILPGKFSASLDILIRYKKKAGFFINRFAEHCPVNDLFLKPRHFV